MTPSLPGLVGAAMALVVGLINYRVIVALVESRLRALDRSETPEQRALFESKLAQMRQIVLWTDIVAFACGGYLLGQTIGG